MLVATTEEILHVTHNTHKLVLQQGASRSEGDTRSKAPLVSNDFSTYTCIYIYIYMHTFMYAFFLSLSLSLYIYYTYVHWSVFVVVLFPHGLIM